MNKAEKILNNFDFDDYVKKIIKDERVQKLIKKHNLTSAQVNDAILIFSQIVADKREFPDYVIDIKVHSNGLITKLLVPSEWKIRDLKLQKNHKLQEISLLNKNVSLTKKKNQSTKKSTSQLGLFNNSRFHISFDINDSRRPILEFITSQVRLFKAAPIGEGLFEGFYVYGKPKSGKSLLFSGLANFLLEANRSIAFIDLSSLSQLVKANFSTGYNSIIKTLQDVDFLFIDSFFHEKLADWFINSVLIPLLSYRIHNNKSIFFNSNFSISILKNHLHSLYKNTLTPYQIEMLYDKIKSLASREFRIRY